MSIIHQNDYGDNLTNSKNLLTDLPDDILCDVISLVSSNKEELHKIIITMLCISKNFQIRILNIIKLKKFKMIFLEYNQQRIELYTQLYNIYIKLPLEYIDRKILSELIDDYVTTLKYNISNPLTIIFKQYFNKNNSTLYVNELMLIQLVYNIVMKISKERKVKKGNLNIYGNGNVSIIIKWIIRNSKYWINSHQNYKLYENSGLYKFIIEYLENINISQKINRLFYSVTNENWLKLTKILPNIYYKLPQTVKNYINNKINIIEYITESSTFLPEYILYQCLTADRGLIIKQSFFIKHNFVQIYPMYTSNLSHGHQKMLLDIDVDKYLKYCSKAMQINYFINIFNDQTDSYHLLENIKDMPTFTQTEIVKKDVKMFKFTTKEIQISTIENNIEYLEHASYDIQDEYVQKDNELLKYCSLHVQRGYYNYPYFIKYIPEIRLNEIILMNETCDYEEEVFQPNIYVDGSC